MFFQLTFKAFKQSERIGRRTGKTGNDLVFVHTPHLAGIGFHHGIAKCYLAVPTHYHLLAFSD